MPVDRIEVGPRCRRDLGDVQSLARNIEELGLLQPIVVTPAGELIAGARRLAAWRVSAFADQPIPVNVVALEQIARGEAAENGFRKQLLPSEMAAVARALEPIEKARAAERQRAHGGTAPGRKATPSKNTGDRIEHLAPHVGVSARTLQKILVIIAASERDPSLKILVEKMDRTGRVDPCYKQVALKRGQKRRTVVETIFDRTIIGGHSLNNLSVAAARALLHQLEGEVAVLSAVLAHIGVPPDEMALVRDLISETDLQSMVRR